MIFFRGTNPMSKKLYIRVKLAAIDKSEVGCDLNSKFNWQLLFNYEIFAKYSQTKIKQKT